MTPTSARCLAALLGAATAGILFPAASSATTYTWDGGITNGATANDN